MFVCVCVCVCVCEREREREREYLFVILCCNCNVIDLHVVDLYQVRQHDVEPSKEGDRGSKMVSEIYLPRLLVTKVSLGCSKIPEMMLCRNRQQIVYKHSYYLLNTYITCLCKWMHGHMYLCMHTSVQTLCRHIHTHTK